LAHSRYAWFLPESVGRPLVVLQHGFEGPWERDPIVAPDVSGPIGFWLVQNDYGPVLRSSSGVLVDPTLGEVLQSSNPRCGVLVPAVVSRPQDILPPRNYFLVRAREGKQIAELRVSSPAPQYAYVESPAVIVFNESLCALVKALPGITFLEPRICR